VLEREGVVRIWRNQGDEIDAERQAFEERRDQKKRRRLSNGIGITTLSWVGGDVDEPGYPTP
jgi:hypothetical protein